MNNPADQGLSLPPLSNQAAVEILDFLEAMFQAFETRYASQIQRYYLNNNIVRPPSSASSDDEPF